MRLHRFILPYAAFRASSADIEDAALTHQLKTVLKVRIGEEVLLCDGDDTEVVATVRGYAGDVTSFALSAPYELQTGPARGVTLYLAITKRDTFEWACQKAVECGAARIIPVLSAHTVKQNVSVERLRAIAKEAAEQSGRGSVPQVDEPVPFAAALVASPEELRLIASTRGGELIGMTDLSAAHRVSVLIGPEGGFSEQEERDAAAAGWKPVSLGSRVLRAETAAIIATYQLA